MWLLYAEQKEVLHFSCTVLMCLSNWKKQQQKLVLPGSLSQGIFGKQKCYRAALATFVSEMQQKVVIIYLLVCLSIFNAKDITCCFIEFLNHFPDVHFLIAKAACLYF